MGTTMRHDMKGFRRFLSGVLTMVIVLSMVSMVPMTHAQAAASSYISTTYASSLSVKTTKAAGLMTEPVVSANAKYTVPADTMLTVTALHKSTAGTYWYEVLFYDMTLYVDATAVTKVSHLTGDVKATGLMTPAAIGYGSGFPLRGKVTATRNTLGKITAAVHYNSNLSEAPAISASVNVGGRSYTMDNSTLDYNMTFGSLGRGSYTFLLTVEAVSYYINDNGALATSKQTVVLDNKPLVVTDVNNPNPVVARGIDVSTWQGYIDWSAASKEIDFAILRLGYETSTDGQFHNNAAGCNTYGVPFGVYHYSYALNEADAVAEAEYVISVLSGYDVALPVFLDFEDPTQVDLDSATKNAIIKAFCDTIAAAGYQPGFYTFLGWFNAYFTDSYYSSMPKWIAQINSTCTYTKGVTMWQYSWEGSVSGISGDVDMNYWYGEFPGKNTDSSYLGSCTVYPANFTAKTTDSVNCRKYPNTNQTTLETLASGTQIHVTGVAKNPAGAYWYQIERNGTTGYISADYATPVEFLYDDLSVIDPIMNDIPLNTGFNLRGTLHGKYNSLYKVNAKVYSGENTLATPVISSTATVNSKEYSLYLSQVCDNLSFRKLSAGYYTYEISTDVKNYYVSDGVLKSKTQNVVVWTAPFTVGGAAITPPSEWTCAHKTVTEAGRPATCSQTGLTEKIYCSLCGVVLQEATTLPVVSHNYVNGTCEDCGVAPIAPPTLTASAERYVTLTMNAVGAEKYAIYRSTDGKTFSLLAESQNGTYVDTNVANDKTYYYRATSYRGKEFSSESATVSITVPGFDKADIRPSFTATQTATSITLNWGKIEGIDGYKIYRKAPGETSYTALKAIYDPEATSYTDPDLESGKVYGYLIHSFYKDADNVYHFSATSGGKLVYTQPTAPKGTTEYAYSGGVKITITEPVTCTGYAYARSDDGGHSFNVIYTGPEDSYVDNSVEVGKTYYYRVYAYAGDITVRSSSTGAGSIVAWPEAPVIASIECNASGVTFTWDAVEGVTGYKIWRKLPNTTSWTNFGLTNELSYTDTTAAAGTTYVYAVQAYQTVDGTHYYSKLTDVSKTFTANANCVHSWASGVCGKCGAICAHTDHGTTGACTKCGITNADAHTYVDTVTKNPGCTTPGIRTYTCKCGHSYTEDIPATNHSYTAKVTPSTCTSGGYTTYTCSSCSDSYTGNETPMTDHSYVNGFCSECNAAEPVVVRDFYLIGYINGADYGCEGDYANMGEYKFVDGKLTATFEATSYVFVKTTNNAAWYMTDGWLGEVSSATLYNTTTLGENANKLQVPADVEITFTLVENADGTLTLSYTVPAPELFDITFAQAELGNALSMRFAFPAASQEDWTGAYAVATKTYADGRDDVVETIPAAEWKSAAINGADHYYFSFNNISGKEMSDDITVVVYNAAGEAISNPYTDSIRTYIMRALDTQTNAKVLTLMVDMLNYGATAQSYFGYGTGDLANALLSDEQKALGTQTMAPVEDGRVKGDHYMGTRLELKSSIIMCMAFDGMTTDMTAKIEYTNHRGVLVSETVTPENVNGTVMVVIDQIVVADGRQDVTVTVYNTDGSVYGSATDSMESYLSRVGSDDLYNAIMIFSDSAYAYLHRND